MSLDPYYPNVALTEEDIIRSGFKVRWLDHGTCTYGREEGNKLWVFYLNMADDCKKVESQEIYIDLRKNLEYEKLSTEPMTITQEDSTAIVNELKGYRSRKISKFNQIAQCRSTFMAENKSGIRLEWSIYQCDEYMKLSAYSDVKKTAQNIKHKTTTILLATQGLRNKAWRRKAVSIGHKLEKMK